MVVNTCADLASLHAQEATGAPQSVKGQDILNAGLLRLTKIFKDEDFKLLSQKYRYIVRSFVNRKGRTFTEAFKYAMKQDVTNEIDFYTLWLYARKKDKSEDSPKDKEKDAKLKDCKVESVWQTLKGLESDIEYFLRIKKEEDEDAKKRLSIGRGPQADRVKKEKKPPTVFGEAAKSATGKGPIEAIRHMYTAQYRNGPRGHMWGHRQVKGVKNMAYKKAARQNAEDHKKRAQAARDAAAEKKGGAATSPVARASGNSRNLDFQWQQKIEEIYKRITKINPEAVTLKEAKFLINTPKDKNWTIQRNSIYLRAKDRKSDLGKKYRTILQHIWYRQDKGYLKERVLTYNPNILLKK